MYHGWEQSTLEKYLTAEACGEPLKVKVGGGNWTHINDFWPQLWGPATLFYNRSKVYGIKISQPLRTYAYNFIKKEKKCNNWSQTDKTGWKTKHLIRKKQKKQKQKPTTLNCTEVFCLLGVMLAAVCQGLQYWFWMVNGSLTHPCISIPTIKERTVMMYDWGGHCEHRL